MNPKQEKRFWSADQKRFVYSLKLHKVILYTVYYNDTVEKIQYRKESDCEGFLNGIRL